jgi:hypothetical protein
MYADDMTFTTLAAPSVIKDWTFMVYMAADNSLDSFALLDLNEMEVVGSSNQTNVVALVDRLGDNNTSLYYVVKQELANDTIVSVPVTPNPFEPEADMGNATTLTNFINWVETNYPANHYALVLWNHGNGWRTLTAIRQPVIKSICFDDTSGSRLSLADLHTALQAADIAPGLIGFDACEMQMVEVADELHNILPGSVIVGSEDTEPGEGWPYDAVLNGLNAAPTENAMALASNIVTQYMAEYPSVPNITMSAVNIAGTGNLTTAIDSFASLMQTNTEHENITAARTLTQSYFDTDYVDLYDLVDKVQSRVADPGIQYAATAVKTAVNSMVISSGNSTDVPGTHGISIYFPDTTYSTDYNNLTFASHDWDEFLRWYLNPASATVTLSNLNQTYDGDPKSVTVTTNPVGLSVSVSYNGSATLPINAGSYAVVATITDPNNTGSANGTLVIAKATPVFSNLISATINWSDTPTILGGTLKAGSLIPPGNVTITLNNVSQLAAINGMTGNFSSSFATGGLAVTGSPYTITYIYVGSTNFDSVGPDISKTLTVNAVPPAVTTLPAADVTFSNATLNGNLTYKGSASTVQVYFQWGVNPTFTNTTATQPMNANGSFADNLTGLGSNTTYIYRAVASGDGIVYGGNQTFITNRANATVTLDNLTQTYDGTPKQVTVTTSPVANLTCEVTYNGTETPPTNAGSYVVVATITNPNYTGSASDTLVISRANQTITFALITDKVYGDADFTLNATATSSLPVTYTATGNCTIVSGNTVHINGTGNCTVTAHQVGNENYNAAPDVSRTFAVKGAAATVTLSNLNQIYDGTPKNVTVTITVANITSSLSYVVTYNGSETLPVNAGNYTVLATITDPNYSGSAGGTLVISRATPVFSNLISATINWSDTPTILGGTLKAGLLIPPGNVTISLSGVIQSATIDGTTGNFSSSFATGGLVVTGSPYTIIYTYAGNTNFDSAGPDTSKTLTVNAVPPVVNTLPATGITPFAATLNGNLTDKGSAGSVIVSFQWDENATYRNETATQLLNTTGVFNASISGLKPSTTYHFRVKAAGDVVAYGNDSTFVTITIPLSVVVTPDSPVIPFISGHEQNVTFKATVIYTDGNTTDETNNATWLSGNESVAYFVAASATASLATINSPGTSLISATYAPSIVGNTTLTVLPDTTPPVLSLNSPSNGITISANSLNVTGMVDDTAATVSVTINSGTPIKINFDANGTFSQAITLLNGTNQIIVRAVDPAGNIGTSGTMTVTVKVTTIPIPLVTVTSPNDGLLTNNPNITVTGTVSNATTVTVKVNEWTKDGNVTNGKFSVPFISPQALSEGTNIIVAYAYPANQTANATLRGSSGIIYVDLDRMIPVVSINSPVSNSTVSTAVVNVQGTVDDPLINFATLTLNNGTQTIPVSIGSFSQIFMLSTASNGTNTIKVEATDEADNIGNATAMVTLNTTKPVVRITAPVNRFLTNSTNVIVNGTVDNPTIGNITLWVNNNSIPVIVTPGSFSGNVTLVNGTNTIEARASDNAIPSNNGTSGVISVTLHTAPPALTLGLTDPTDSVSILVSSDEALKEPFTVVVANETGSANVTMTRVAMLNWVGTFAPVIVNSAYNVTVTAADKAGNFATQRATFSNKQITVTENTTTIVNCTNTQLAIQTTSNVTNATITVTQHEENPSGVVNNPGAANVTAGLFVEINASPELRDNLKQIEIKVYYNATQLLAQGKDPTTLKLYWWDETLGVWAEVPGSGPGSDAGGTFIKGILTHLSKYGVFGSVIATSTTTGTTGGGGGESGKLVKLDDLKNSAPYEFRLAFTGATQTNVQLKSDDDRLSIDIASGTYLRDKVGNALGALSVGSLDSPPAPPSGSVLVTAYNFGPDGAVFDPGINLTLSYDPKTLPAGAREEELYTAWWNGTNWQALTGTVNTAARTVSVKVNHFTQFALISKLPSASPTPLMPIQTPVPAAAKFSVFDLNIAPASVKTGEIVTVTATVTNSGGSQGRYTVSLRVNGVEEEKKELTLNTGAVEKVSFTVKKSAAGTYSVDVNGLAGQFTVKEEAKASPTSPPVPQEGGINATTIIIIVLVAVVAGLVAFFLLRKRHT